MDIGANLNISQHAYQRYLERILMGLPDLTTLVSSKMISRDCKTYPPIWYAGAEDRMNNPISNFSSIRWVTLKDLDGGDMCAAVDSDRMNVVTLVKR